MIQLFGEQLSGVEIFGTIFGIAGVWLTVKENRLCFPVGIVNVALYAWLFFKSRLYADASLQLVYIILLIYGWTQWKLGSNKKTIPVTGISRSTMVRLVVVCLASTAAIGTFFRYKTNASLPYVDSFTTSMSLVAQWLVAKKKIENWLWWIVADIIYVSMYIYKHLYLTSLLYFIFILLAFIGLQQWKKDLKKEVAA